MRKFTRHTPRVVYYMCFFRCPQNGGVARGVGACTDDKWREFVDGEVRGRFKTNPRKCHLLVSQYFAGADDVRKCLRPQSLCGFYLRQLSGANDTDRVI